jgi:transposase
MKDSACPQAVQPALLEVPPETAKPSRVEEATGEAEAQEPARLRRPQRSQTEWAPRCLDDLIAPDHPARMMAKVVAGLDWSKFYQPIKAREGVAGRDSTDPELLVSLWLYGCVRGIGSARELARRCEESAPFLWLCGGVSVNHRMLSEFRTGNGEELDDLFTQVLVALVDKGVVKVSRISQDGMRVRVGAGSASFRSEERIGKLVEEVKQHVAELRRQVENAAYGAKAEAKRAEAALRRAAEKLERLKAAEAELPEIKQQLAEAAKRAGKGKSGDKIRNKIPRVSTTDAEARVMKMANGGFNPAVNAQLATDTESRVIVGVAVSKEGSDSGNLSAPMREQVEQRTGGKVEQQLLDGGYLKMEDIEAAHQQGVELFVPPKPARSEERKGHELDPKPGDSEAVQAWKQRMSSEAGKEIYKQRASTSETVNADLRQNRGLRQIHVRGHAKGLCVVLWCALAHNILYFGSKLLQ